MAKNMIPTYTLKEVVARLAKSKLESEIALLTRQVRHWTVIDLVRPLGEKFTGQGKHRNYPHEELFVIQLLRTVSPFTASASHLRHLRKSVDEWLVDPMRRPILMGETLGYVTVITADDGTLYWSMNKGVPDGNWFIYPNEDGEGFTPFSAILFINCQQLAYEAGLITNHDIEISRLLEEQDRKDKNK